MNESRTEVATNGPTPQQEIERLTHVLTDQHHRNEHLHHELNLLNQRLQVLEGNREQLVYEIESWRDLSMTLQRSAVRQAEAKQYHEADSMQQRALTYTLCADRIEELTGMKL